MFKISKIYFSKDYLKKILILKVESIIPAYSFFLIIKKYKFLTTHNIYSGRSRSRFWKEEEINFENCSTNYRFKISYFIEYKHFFF